MIKYKSFIRALEKEGAKLVSRGNNYYIYSLNDSSIQFFCFDESGHIHSVYIKDHYGNRNEICNHYGKFADTISGVFRLAGVRRQKIKDKMKIIKNKIKGGDCLRQYGYEKYIEGGKSNATD